MIKGQRPTEKPPPPGRLTFEQLYGKVSSIGSVIDVIDFGCTHEDVPEEIAPLWKEAEEALRTLERVEDQIFDVLTEKERDGWTDR